MSKPHNKIKNPEQPGQIKTMFAVEGNLNVFLVTEEHGLQRAEPMRFSHVGKAFAWCRRNRCNFVYHPAPPNN